MHVVLTSPLRHLLSHWNQLVKHVAADLATVSENLVQFFYSGNLAKLYPAATYRAIGTIRSLQESCWPFIDKEQIDFIKLESALLGETNEINMFTFSLTFFNQSAPQL